MDIDSTPLDTYGSQEGEGFNYHYQKHGYHPLLCFDGLTGDLLKAELREGTKYCSNGAGTFIEPLLEEYRSEYPELPLYLRGDSGFASPDLYENLEEKDCKYAIRLQVHVLAYNLFNWFKRLVLPVSMRRQQIDTIRLKLLKIAARVVRSARYKIFNPEDGCSCCC